MTPIQASCLLRKHLTGEFPARKLSTISALMREGMLEVVDGHYRVSDAGKRYCDENHKEIQ